MNPKAAVRMTTILWLRKCLRLHDNPLLVEIANQKNAGSFYPIFILDPAFYNQHEHQKGVEMLTSSEAPHTGTGVGGPNANVFSFFLDTLHTLEKKLDSVDSKLLCFKGNPKEVFRHMIDTSLEHHQQQNKKSKNSPILRIVTEHETEPFGRNRDKEIQALVNEYKGSVEFVTMPSHHTLVDPEALIKSFGGVRNLPKTYKSFCNALYVNESLEVSVDLPLAPPTKSQIGDRKPTDDEFPLSKLQSSEFAFNEKYKVPATLLELGFSKAEIPKKEDRLYIGGEEVGLSRLHQYCMDKKKVLEFEKPKTRPNALIPDTTVLSPYLTTGCLSPRAFYHKVNTVYKESSKKHTEPPVSLHGQLLFREWFYLKSYVTPNFHQMKDNPLCLHVPWNRMDGNKVSDSKKKQYIAWCTGRTGYPFIDACMRQLNTEGWIHHLARHAVACFLTRGDLWISWEDGRRYFDRVLLDGDYALNNANWMWLSASAFFTSYFRVYSPIAFGKKTDANGDYIRKYVPELKNYPRKYIYEPWKAPLSVQQHAKCIVGKDYPRPIVDHEKAKKENMEIMKYAYQRKKRGSNAHKATCDIKLNYNPDSPISPVMDLSFSKGSKNSTKEGLTSKKGKITEFLGSEKTRKLSSKKRKSPGL